jgi:hypothetical protein
MAAKLEEFRLESYDERSTLQHALTYLRSHDPDNFYKPHVEALLTRLSRTECQPGGCSYCGDRGEDYE